MTADQGVYLRNGEEWPPHPAFSADAFVLPADLIRIEESAFENVPNVTAVDASHCAFIGPNAFKGCADLTQIRLAKDCEISPAAFDAQVIYVFAPAGGTTEAYCGGDGNLVFVDE